MQTVCTTGFRYLAPKPVQLSTGQPLPTFDPPNSCHLIATSRHRLPSDIAPGGSACRCSRVGASWMRSSSALTSPLARRADRVDFLAGERAGSGRRSRIGARRVRWCSRARPTAAELRARRGEPTRPSGGHSRRSARPHPARPATYRRDPARWRRDRHDPRESRCRGSDARRVCRRVRRDWRARRRPRSTP